MITEFEYPDFEENVICPECGYGEEIVSSTNNKDILFCMLCGRKGTRKEFKIKEE